MYDRFSLVTYGPHDTRSPCGRAPRSSPCGSVSLDVVMHVSGWRQARATGWLERWGVAFWVAALVVACRGEVPGSAPGDAGVAHVALSVPAPSAAACAVGVPAAACAQRRGLQLCRHGERRVGEWRYAVITRGGAVLEDLAWDRLAAAWRRGEVAASAETAAAVTTLLGRGAPPVLPAEARAALAASALAIVPAEQLVPAWKVVTIDGHHPLAPEPAGLAVALCAAEGDRDPAPVRNIDPQRLTTVAITGVTALTRLTAELIDRKGAEYLVKDVEPWLAAVDLVHISHEVSFVDKECRPYHSLQTEFCAREGYIKVLEAAHAKIIELTGSHLPDYGRAWITHTLAMYRERGWVWFGGGRDQLDGTAARIVEHHGNRLAFLGCNMPWTTSHVITEGPGVAACDLARIRWQLADLVRQGIVPIVSIQHEEVYQHDPPDEIVRDFRNLAEAGAAVVNGSQAHSAHPWEVHHGAYVHYGGGNFLFDQQATNTQDAAADKLYIHAGKLLAVGHLYTRLEEHGRPRPMTERERLGFLATMNGALARLRPAAPWAAPRLMPASRHRPDSFLLGARLVHVDVEAPATLEPGRRYSMVIALDEPGPAPAAGDVFVVTPERSARGARGLGAAVARFMRAKYPIDADHGAVWPAPRPPGRGAP